MADADKTARQHMQQKPAQEFVGRDGHVALLVAVSVVLPAEGDLTVGEGDQPVVGDGHAMGIAGQVVEHVFWSAEGWLGVDNPILPEQLSQKAAEGLAFTQVLEAPVEVELFLTEKVFQPGDELAAKDAAEHSDRKEEVMLRMNPARVIWRQTAGGDYTVGVGMRLSDYLSDLPLHRTRRSLGTSPTITLSDAASAN